MKKTIDARGLTCPGPVIEAKKVLQTMSEGSLEVLVDNEIAVQNLRKMGQYFRTEVQDKKLQEQSYQVVFNLQGGTDTAGNEASQKEQTAQKTVVISSELMGQGDEVLGRILMKGFIYALTELDQLPQTIIFYNSGVKLSVEGAESLADLQQLEDSGVEIMSCGTCLKHYGLEHALGVGTISNMYTIAEVLLSSETIVKP